MFSTKKFAALALSASLVLGACGGGNDDSETGTSSARLKALLARAQNTSPTLVPPVKGRTLQQLADRFEGGPKLGLATSEYVPGRNRIAFGILDAKDQFVYAPSAVYVARPGDRARGPFPAPADSLLVEPRYRSRNAAKEGSALAAVFSTNAPLARPGRYEVLVATKLGSRLLGAATGIRVSRSLPIPQLGERPPRVATDTVASTTDRKLLDTRVPPDDMHRVNFKDVLGKRPVALLFATPQLCVSRVCGPVTDIAEQLEQTYGDRVEFIHQEVYVDNDATKGYRPSLRAFGLRSEPWLFTFDKEGRVAARLEGSFGINEFRQALEKSLR